MSDIDIHIKFFGAFKKLGEGIDISVPVGSSISSVKEILDKALDGKEKFLIEASALANDNSILRDEVILERDTELSILPPVCGG